MKPEELPKLMVSTKNVNENMETRMYGITVSMSLIIFHLVLSSKEKSSVCMEGYLLIAKQLIKLEHLIGCKKYLWKVFCVILLGLTQIT